MTAARRHKPAGATRELLQAIHDYLDLPFVADWDEEPTRDSELLERAARLVGRLETMLDSGTIEDAADTVRGWLGKPLPYEPETPAQTAERHSRLARTLREMREPPGQPERPNGRAPGNS